MAQRRAIALAAVLSFGSCGDNNRLPTAPTELTTGIVIYQHANFLGESAHITSDIENLESVRGPCVRSDTDANGNTSEFGACVTVTGTPTVSVGDAHIAEDYTLDDHSIFVPVTLDHASARTVTVDVARGPADVIYVGALAEADGR